MQLQAKVSELEAQLKAANEVNEKQEKTVWRD
jgi:hypothetical protein